jgi:hypothetical protein
MKILGRAAALPDPKGADNFSIFTWVIFTKVCNITKKGSRLVRVEIQLLK